MPKFKVTIEETVVYHVEVEADDEDDAKVQAEEMFVQAEETGAFFSHVDDREATDVEELDE